MEHKDVWLVLGLTVILAVAVSLTTVSLTGDVVWNTQKVTPAPKISTIGIVKIPATITPLASETGNFNVVLRKGETVSLGNLVSLENAKLTLVDYKRIPGLYVDTYLPVFKLETARGSVSYKTVQTDNKVVYTATLGGKTITRGNGEDQSYYLLTFPTNKDKNFGNGLTVLVTGVYSTNKGSSEDFVTLSYAVGGYSDHLNFAFLPEKI